jgi:putative selenium metabolism protein SsnA
MSAVLSGGLVARSLDGPVEAIDLVVGDGRIGGKAAAAEHVDASGCVIVPGNACAHHHVYSALARGMPGPARAPRDFLGILNSIWWRLDRALDLETIRLCALAAALDAARCGTTALVDHHASPHAIEGSLDVLADALAEAGMRAVLCYEVTDRHGAAGATRGIAENLRFLSANRRPSVRAMMGAHASFTLGAQTLETLVGSARDVGAPVHVHLAEDEYDERHSMENYGVRTARRLSDAGALGEGDLVAHGVWLDADEIALVRASGAWLAHNPRSNMHNGVGYAPALTMGERVALGTDGMDGDMFAETKVAYLRARERSLEASPADVVRRLAAGATVVGSIFGEPELGSLEPGAPADLVVLEYRSPTPLDGSNLPGHLLFGMGSWAVRDVMVAGRWIMRAGRHQLIEEDEVAALCQQGARRLWSRMAEL